MRLIESKKGKRDIASGTIGVISLEGYRSSLDYPISIRKKAPGCGKNEAEHAFVSGLLASNLLD
jgi:hypothetical protein